LVSDYFSALWPPTHCSSIFRLIHSEAPSVFRAIADKALFRDCPVIMKVRHSDRAGNPLQPTSTGKHHAIQPLSTQLSVRAWYFVSFLSKLSSILSSHGTVSSTKASCLVKSDHITMSGLRLVTVISCGNMSWLYRSTSSFQSLAVPRISLALFAPLTSCPALTKEMSEGPLLTVLCARLDWSRCSAMDDSTLSWRHLYLPSDKAVLHMNSAHAPGSLGGHRVCSQDSQIGPKS